MWKCPKNLEKLNGTCETSIHCWPARICFFVCVWDNFLQWEVPLYPTWRKPFSPGLLIIHQESQEAFARLTSYISHLPIKSHLLAGCLLQSSLGSQPFSTLYSYLRWWSPPEQLKKRDYFGPFGLAQWQVCPTSTLPNIFKPRNSASVNSFHRWMLTRKYSSLQPLFSSNHRSNHTFMTESRWWNIGQIDWGYVRYYHFLRTKTRLLLQLEFCFRVE